MTSAPHLAALTDSAEVIAALSDLLVEVVANGGSVSFMHPLARDVAADFWKDSLARARSGGRVVLGSVADCSASAGSARGRRSDCRQARACEVACEA